MGWCRDNVGPTQDFIGVDESKRVFFFRSPTQRDGSFGCYRVEIDFKPPHEAHKEPVPFGGFVFCGRDGSINVEYRQSTSIVVRVAVTSGRDHHNVGVGVGVDGILLPPHVVGIVVDTHNLMYEKTVVENAY